MGTSRPMIALFFTLSIAALAQSDLLPPPTCFLLEMAFKSLGCADGSSPVPTCEYIALALRLELETGEGLCTAKPCIGYGTTGQECTNLFPRSCSSSKRISEGVCPLGKECCKA